MLRKVLLLFTVAANLRAQSSIASRTLDLNFISSQLPHLDPNFFSSVSPSMFQQAVSSLQANLATVTDAQYYVALAQLVAMAGDAHTYLYLSAVPGSQTLPLHLRWLDDGVFVTSAGPEYLSALGTQLVAINGMPMDNVMSLLGTVIPHENDQWLHYAAQSYLVQQQTLQGLGIAPADAAVPMTFQKLDGSVLTLSLTASNEARTSLISVTTGTIPDYLLDTLSNYWFKYSAANRLLYFKYNVCESDPANPFSSFASAVLSVIDANPIDTLVFDFRANTGGDDSVINPLLTGIEQRILHLRSNPNFAFYTVIDKGTFSSGMDDAEDLKQPSLGLAPLVIGEPTGGKPAHFGNVANFVLPGSQIPGQYSQQYFAGPSYIPSSDASFEPDIRVAIRSVDYFARFDPVMAAILTRWQGPLPVSGGTATIVNGASYRSDVGIAPGSLATAFGAFSTVPDAVLVSGSAAQVLAATPTQVNFLVPQAVAIGSTSVSILAAGDSLATATVTIVPASPGIFVLQAADPQQPGAVENQDSTVNGPSNPAAPGSVVQIYATGLGGAESPVQVFFGDIPAQVLYSGTTVSGLWQINATLPAEASGIIPVFMIVGKQPSNAVSLVTH